MCVLCVEEDDVVDVVVVVLHTSNDVITMNVTQYSVDCTDSLFQRTKSINNK